MQGAASVDHRISMIRTRVLRLIEPLIGFAGLLAAWEVASRIARNATLVPPPAKVWSALLAMMNSEMPKDITASLVHLAAGYSAGAAVGLVLALVAGSSKWLAAVIDPFAEFLRPISPIAWVPLAILMFGVGGAVPIFLIFYAAVFPIFIGTLDGIRRVDPTLVNAARALGASRRMLALRVIFPAALPSI